MNDFVASLNRHEYESARDAIEAISAFEASTLSDWEYSVRAVMLAGEITGWSVRLNLPKPPPEEDEENLMPSATLYLAPTKNAQMAMYQHAAQQFLASQGDTVHLNLKRAVGKVEELGMPFGGPDILTHEDIGQAPVAHFMENRRVWGVTEKSGEATGFDTPEAASEWADRLSDDRSSYYAPICGQYPRRTDFTVMKDASIKGFILRVNTPVGYYFMRRQTV